MTARRPAVSVVLPVRNGMPHLPRAVESILGQTWGDLELLAIDDGSVDETGAYLRGLADARVRILATGGEGLGAALNAGLQAARAPLVARQDADDWSAPHRLAEQMGRLHARPDIDVLATEASFVDAAGQPMDTPWTRTVHAQWDVAVEPETIAALMPLTCCIFHATVVARTDMLRQAGGYDAAMVPAEDYDLWLRLLPRARFARVSEPLYTVRVHAESSSSRRRADQTERVIAAKLRYLRRVCPDLPPYPSLALPSDDRGAAVVRAVAPRERYGLVPAPSGGRTDHSPGTGPASWRQADVVVVTDFSTLPRWVAQLALPGTHWQVGNFFVKREFLARRERRAEAGPADRDSEPRAHRA